MKVVGVISDGGAIDRKTQVQPLLDSLPNGRLRLVTDIDSLATLRKFVAAAAQDGYEHIVLVQEDISEHSAQLVLAFADEIRHVRGNGPQ